MGQFRNIAILGGALTLSACVPPSADSVRRNAPPAPILAEPNLETLYDEKPVWEARPVTASATNVATDAYVVQAGDTLTAIANRTGASVEAIATTNGLAAPYAIRIGQTLTIPGGRYHRVAQGESGIAIARAYATPWVEIIALNNLQEPYTLRVGQRLKLPPEGGAPVSGSIADTKDGIEVRAAAFKLNIEDIITGGEPALEPQQTATAPVAAPTRPIPATAAVSIPESFSGQFAWPLRGPIVSRFGTMGDAQRNDGIEIGGALGSPIMAAGDGVVAFVGDGVAGYGGMILIRHGSGWITAYGRAGEARVTRGQSVKKGQIIGRIGDFGNTAGPQLHFQIRQGRAPVDPAKYLPPTT